MIRLFKIVNPVEYKDFENYLFSFPDKITFDFPNDKLTIETVDYRISSLLNLDDNTSGSGTSQNEIKEVSIQVNIINSNTTFNVIPNKTKTIAFENKGETDITINNNLELLPDASYIFGGEKDTISNNFTIEFSGTGINNLIVITELYL